MATTSPSTAKKNVFLTSSFTGWNNYMMDLGKLIKDAEAMKHFGNTMVLWNLKSMQPEKIFSVPGAPLEIRWSLKEGDDWAITFSALTSKLWLINHDANNEWQAKEVAHDRRSGQNSAARGRLDFGRRQDLVGQHVHGRHHPFVRHFRSNKASADLRESHRQAGQHDFPKLGRKARLYHLLAACEHWDKKGADNEQVLRAYDWDGKDLKLKFEVDFFAEKLGRPHHMKFSGPARESLARHAGPRGIAVTKRATGALLFRPCCKSLIAAAGIFAAVLPLGAEESAGLPPPPGSYTLDHIQRVPAGIVLEGTRFPRALSRYTTGAITLLAFFYSYCADPNGCPLAWDAFEKVREGIIARPELHGRVRLVFMSLDPAHDTPGMLMGFARRYEASASIVPWHFLTTYSNLFLKPVLRDMGEEISIDREASGGAAWS